MNRKDFMQLETFDYNETCKEPCIQGECAGGCGTTIFYFADEKKEEQYCYKCKRKRNK